MKDKLFETELQNGKVIKKGDRVRLLGKVEDNDVYKYLYDRRHCYRFIKFRNDDNPFYDLDVPKLITGFEDPIEYFENKGAIIYTKHFCIRNVRGDNIEYEIIENKEAISSESENKVLSDFIQEIMEIDENYRMGLITYFERNNFYLAIYSQFYSHNYSKKWRVDRNRIISQMKPYEREEEYLKSWSKLLDKSGEGFLYDSKKRNTQCNIGKWLVNEFKKRGWHRKTRFNYNFSGYIISRSRFDFPKDNEPTIAILVTCKCDFKSRSTCKLEDLNFRLSLRDSEANYRVVTIKDLFNNNIFLDKMNEIINLPL